MQNRKEMFVIAADAIMKCVKKDLIKIGSHESKDAELKRNVFKMEKDAWRVRG